ncbi:MAG: zinc-ribbon domain-containing protein [Planctomycetia bacterium]|nr:zinc-ribbon domain-containing protein [Planctomycetia bacterium]
MPITLGCPSCGKRFRARDESAGKKVKCPYCQAAVQVPTSEESAVAGAPTAPLPSSPSGSGSVLPPSVIPPSSRPLPPPVVAPADWGASPAAPKLEPEPLPPPPPLPLPTRGGKGKPAAKPAPKPPRPSAADKTPEQLAAGAWRKARGGLAWVLFALFILALPGFVGFGKAVYTRAVGDLPKGDGWIKIEGYVNSGANSVTLRKEDEIKIATYWIPVALAGLALVLGRVTAGAAPRASGARGLFAMSGLFTFFALAGLGTHVVCEKLLFEQEARYGGIAFVLCGALAEYWFLMGLTASGLSLKRPGVARTVGFLGFLAALGVAIALVGWDLYVKYLRPNSPDADVLMYEQAALMLGWLLAVGVYWRAVGGVRAAIREYLDTVEEG